MSKNYRDDKILSIYLSFQEVAYLYDAIGAYQMDQLKDTDVSSDENQRLSKLYDRMSDAYHGLKKDGYRWAGSKCQVVVHDPNYKLSLNDLCNWPNED